MDLGEGMAGLTSFLSLHGSFPGAEGAPRVTAWVDITHSVLLWQHRGSLCEEMFLGRVPEESVSQDS